MPTKSDRVANTSPWFPIASVMATFCTVMYICLTVFYTIGLLIYLQIIIVPETNDEVLEKWHTMLLKNISAASVCSFTAQLIVYLIMSILSVLLMVGLNMQRHRLISPWLIAACIFVGTSFCTTVITLQMKDLVDFIVIGLQVFMWFPIYTCYKKMRRTRFWKQSGFISSYTVNGQTSGTRQCESTIGALIRKCPF